MVEIRKEIDAIQSSLDVAVKQYLSQVVRELCQTYDTRDISSYGSIFVINELRDWDDYQKFGMSKPVEETPVEFSQRIPLLSSHGRTILYHGCFILNNEFVVDIYCPSQLLPRDIELDWLENLSEG